MARNGFEQDNHDANWKVCAPVEQAFQLVQSHGANWKVYATGGANWKVYATGRRKLESLRYGEAQTGKFTVRGGAICQIALQRKPVSRYDCPATS